MSHAAWKAFDRRIAEVFRSARRRRLLSRSNGSRLITAMIRPLSSTSNAIMRST